MSALLRQIQEKYQQFLIKWPVHVSGELQSWTLLP
jgi:hypothetical protein